MFKRLTLALASLAVLTVAEEVFDINEASQAVEATSDSTDRPIDLSSIAEANMSQLEQSGLPMRVGDSKTFTVRGNPTTGYTWNIDQDATADGVISIEKDYKVDEADPSWTGVTGTYYFKVTANTVGEASLAIWHGRTWESRQNSLQAFNIPIHVNN